MAAFDFEVIMKIAICTENKKLGENIKKQTLRFIKNNGIKAGIFVFNAAVDLIASEEDFDIAFLEACYSTASGFQIGGFLKRKNEAVVLLYLAEDYSCLNSAFDAGARRYLIKPIVEQELVSALASAIDYINKETAECYLEYNGTIKRILKSSIVYLEISGRKTKVVTQNGVFSSKARIQEWQDKLNPAQFASPHKSFIVNLEQVSECRRFSGQYYICMNDNKYIPITRTRKTEFEKSYFQFLKNKSLM